MVPSIGRGTALNQAFHQPVGQVMQPDTVFRRFCAGHPTHLVLEAVERAVGDITSWTSVSTILDAASAIKLYFS